MMNDSDDITGKNFLKKYYLLPVPFVSGLSDKASGSDDSTETIHKGIYEYLFTLVIYTTSQSCIIRKALVKIFLVIFNEYNYPLLIVPLCDKGRVQSCTVS